MFVVRSLPRTGTHLMRSSLCSHPELHCHGEIFHPTLNKRDLSKGALKLLQAYITDPKVGFVVHDPHYRLDPGAVGTYYELWSLIELFTPPIINLHRRDMLRMAVSHELALKTQVWLQESGEVPRENPQCAVKVKEVLLLVADATRHLQRSQRIFPWGLTVFYEDLVTDYDEVMLRVQAYLRVGKFAPLRPNTRKFDMRPLREIVSNWDELCSDLRAKSREDLITIAEENDKQYAVPTQ